MYGHGYSEWSHPNSAGTIGYGMPPGRDHGPLSGHHLESGLSGHRPPEPDGANSPTVGCRQDVLGSVLSPLGDGVHTRLACWRSSTRARTERFLGCLSERRSGEEDVRHEMRRCQGNDLCFRQTWSWYLNMSESSFFGLCFPTWADRGKKVLRQS